MATHIGKKNRLIFIKWVCEQYQSHNPDKTGLSNRKILQRHINTPGNPRPISERTFYKFLNTNYKAELKKIEEPQLTLF